MKWDEWGVVNIHLVEVVPVAEWFFPSGCWRVPSQHWQHCPAPALTPCSVHPGGMSRATSIGAHLLAPWTSHQWHKDGVLMSWSWHDDITCSLWHLSVNNGLFPWMGGAVLGMAEPALLCQHRLGIWPLLHRCRCALGMVLPEWLRICVMSAWHKNRIGP